MINNSLRINEKIETMKKEIKTKIDKKSQEQNDMINKVDYKIQEVKE